MAELLERKARGEAVEAKAIEAPAEAPSNLEAALRESLEAAKEARAANKKKKKKSGSRGKTRSARSEETA